MTCQIKSIAPPSIEYIKNTFSQVLMNSNLKTFIIVFGIFVALKDAFIKNDVIIAELRLVHRKA
jgi:hypothetical protein